MCADQTGDDHQSRPGMERNPQTKETTRPPGPRSRCRRPRRQTRYPRRQFAGSGRRRSLRWPQASTERRAPRRPRTRRSARQIRDFPRRGCAGRAAYADRFRAQPGYRRVWFHGPRIAAVGAVGRQTDMDIADRLHQALVRGYAMPDTELSRRRARLAVVVGGGLLDLAFRERPEGDPEILADAALMMDRYLFAPSSDA
ncbi:hypothetical protein ACFZBU_17775 [Embleya sp. NPDC008237]|uniref:hypothetical protein n=1 Tax=Embleya sp. NPDC008237 TaxID=3363978 RepID=UPI0036E49C18